MEEKAAAAAVQNLSDLCGDSAHEPAFLPNDESQSHLNHSDVCSELSWVDRSQLIFMLFGPINSNVHLAAQLSGCDLKMIMDWVCVHDKNTYIKCWYETAKGMQWKDIKHSWKESFVTVCSHLADDFQLSVKTLEPY